MEFKNIYCQTKTMKKTLKESSVSRIWQHMSEHDTGFISAWRNARDCGDGEKYTRKEKQEADRKLRAYLQVKGYGITRIHGSYIENFNNKQISKNVSEDSYFVVDENDSGNLKNDLIKLGEYFEQDSILFIPMGGKNGKIIGTNDCPDSFPGKENEISIGELAGGESEFYSRIGSKAFKFESKLQPNSLSGLFARKKLAEVFEKELSQFKTNS
jgi:hypothetical protein